MGEPTESEIGHVLRQLYAVTPINELRKELHCSYDTLRMALWEHNIPVRKRGRNSMHTFTLTEGLFDAICRDGVALISQRIGLSYTQLLRHVKTDPRVAEWEKKYQKVL